MEELRRAHAELESNVRELSSDLEIVNKELQTFSSTISHDLRAPLSNISCCCKVLMELWGERLDGECLDFIGKIYGEARRMDQLITTMLNFSRN